MLPTTPLLSRPLLKLSKCPITDMSATGPGQGIYKEVKETQAVGLEDSLPTYDSFMACGGTVAKLHSFFK